MEEDLHGKNDIEVRPQGWWPPQEKFSETRPFGIGTIEERRAPQGGQPARHPQSGTKVFGAQVQPSHGGIERARHADCGAQAEPFVRSARTQVTDKPDRRPTKPCQRER